MMIILDPTAQLHNLDNMLLDTDKRMFQPTELPLDTRKIDQDNNSRRNSINFVSFKREAALIFPTWQHCREPGTTAPAPSLMMNITTGRVVEL